MVNRSSSSTTPKRISTGRSSTREAAAQATREKIIRAATKVFAKHGFDGGSLEKIARAAGSYERMIPYYFGSKEGLFIAVLEETYRQFDEAELKIDLPTDKPVESLKAVIGFMFSYHRQNSEFITLLNTENMYRGKHVSKSRAREYSYRGISILDGLLKSGAASGVFRKNIVARDIYLMIVSMSYFYQSNRFTLSAFLGEDLEAPETTKHWQEFMIDSVLRTVSVSPP
ncbi:TetR/AcrR family transcriptional regulator [Xenophilus azovorans]|uniref:TetR/AcrR family transcriptional regulator n=1 Tax=Xenophilus azovorans TaxID=151755 RepID=UPI00056DE8F1|nr:TetR/AcrR family transcriptional regulator [Xenophilus azovorans]